MAYFLGAGRSRDLGNHGFTRGDSKAEGTGKEAWQDETPAQKQGAGVPRDEAEKRRNRKETARPTYTQYMYRFTVLPFLSILRAIVHRVAYLQFRGIPKRKQIYLLESIVLKDSL